MCLWVPALNQVDSETFLTLSGRSYLGVPVIGFAIQQFTKGYLSTEGGLLLQANYGNGYELSREKSIIQQ